MKIFNGELTLKAQRWPGQKGYNWRGMTNSTAPLNLGGARFGGGWAYKLGIDMGAPSEFGWSILFNLLFGMVSLRFQTAKSIAVDKEWRERSRLSEIAKAELARITAETREREAHKEKAPVEADDEIPF
jgi:hypothetical protein